MPFTYEIEDRLVVFRWSGVMTRADLQALMTVMPELAARAGFGVPVLHHFDDVTSCEFPPLAALDHSAQRRNVVIPGPVKSATIAKRSEVRAMARVFQALNRNPTLQMEIFDSEEAAREWLSRE